MIDDGYGWAIITLFSSLIPCSDDGALSNGIHNVYLCVCVSAYHEDKNEQHDETRIRIRGAREVEGVCRGKDG